jgi:hypothetical protein
MKHINPGNMSLRARVEDLAADPNARAIAVGATAVVLAPVVIPIVRPVLKATIKTGIKLFESAKGAIAETGEILGDIAAEARAEVQVETQQKMNLPAAADVAEPKTAE